MSQPVRDIFKKTYIRFSSAMGLVDNEVKSHLLSKTVMPRHHDSKPSRVGQKRFFVLFSVRGTAGIELFSLEKNVIWESKRFLVLLSDNFVGLSSKVSTDSYKEVPRMLYECLGRCCESCL